MSCASDYLVVLVCCGWPILAVTFVVFQRGSKSCGFHPMWHSFRFACIGIVELRVDVCPMGRMVFRNVFCKWLLLFASIACNFQMGCSALVPWRADLAPVLVLGILGLPIIIAIKYPGAT